MKTYEKVGLRTQMRFASMSYTNIEWVSPSFRHKMRSGRDLLRSDGQIRAGIRSGLRSCGHSESSESNIPTPIEGEGGRGQNQPVEFHFFLLGNPGMVIHPLEWNCKVTFINKPWARVWKYLRLAPEELSASMITAAQIFGGMPSLHMCCFSLTSA